MMLSLLKMQNFIAGSEAHLFNNNKGILYPPTLNTGFNLRMLTSYFQSTFLKTFTGDCEGLLISEQSHLYQTMPKKVRPKATYPRFDKI